MHGNLNMNKQIIPVLLAGGIGSRLQPISTAEHPKQFLSIKGINSSFVELALERAKMINDNSENIVITTSAKFYQQITAGNNGINMSNVIFEPYVRSTAAAMIASLKHVLHKYGDQLVCLIPTDHFISNPSIWASAVHRASEDINKDEIYLFGVKTANNEQDSNYGYILTNANDNRVQEFIEKPTLDQLARLKNHHSLYINTGMVLAYASTLYNFSCNVSAELVDKVTSSYEQATQNAFGIYLEETSYATIPTISIDHFILEHYPNVKVEHVKGLEWLDIGSWESLWQVRERIKQDHIVLVGQFCEHELTQFEYEGFLLNFNKDNIIIRRKEA
jgi:mannose-1-phosphate guanylyltransferase